MGARPSGPVVALLALALVTPRAMAEQAQKTLGRAQDLIGVWGADCDAWGRPASCRIDWSEGLHASHMKITYVVRAKADGSAIFRGEGTYRDEGDAFGGFWSDSQGAVHPLVARWRAETMETHWGVAGGTQGRSVYALLDDGRLRVTDWALTKAGWAPFMEVVYGRAPGVDGSD